MLSDKLKSTGLSDAEDLKTIWPSKERLKKGPVVIVECFQQIPCNPCETSCSQKAIVVGEDINALPRVDHSKCNGCTICVSRCPGLAIFVIDEKYSEAESAVTMPYEFLPLPQKGHGGSAGPPGPDLLPVKSHPSRKHQGPGQDAAGDPGHPQGQGKGCQVL
jgi:Pyruvate/2-oxoacid:ferredoxin oxidoreductase delta subunit